MVTQHMDKAEWYKWGIWREIQNSAKQDRGEECCWAGRKTCDQYRFQMITKSAPQKCSDHLCFSSGQHTICLGETAFSFQLILYLNIFSITHLFTAAVLTPSITQETSQYWSVDKDSYLVIIICRKALHLSTFAKVSKSRTCPSDRGLLTTLLY